MKKHNFLFIGECAIVVALLLLIGVLVRDEKRMVQGRESVTAVVEVDEDMEEKRNFLQKLLPGQNDVAEEESTADLEEIENVIEEEIAEDIVEKMHNENHEPAIVSANESIEIGDAVSANSTSEEDKIKIVVFGDSIWNEGRGTDGISEQVMEQLDVEIYNCAIGGTTAAVPEGESVDWSDWDSRSFNGMMYIATDIVSAGELIPNDEAYNVIKEIDFDDIDYAIVSYGLNDYFSDIPVYPETYYDLNSYVGALRHGVQKLHEEYPDMEFILTSPTYCEWFKGERHYELGTYVECARSVAQEMDLHFLDMYHALGKNPDEKMEFLSDGVHLTKEGRSLYAHSVIEYLKQLEVN